MKASPKDVETSYRVISRRGLIFGGAQLAFKIGRAHV